jgi:hypothetical protein
VVAGVSTPPWFHPDWRALYAKALAEIVKLERLAKEAGRVIRPPKDKP